MNRVDLQNLSRLRRREARVLLVEGHVHGAYYLAGHAVECALKACIARNMRRHEFPNKDFAKDVFTHDLEKLLRLAGLESQLQAAMKTNTKLAVNWSTVKDWDVECRYSSTVSPNVARDMYAACTAHQHGILRWIRSRW